MATITRRRANKIQVVVKTELLAVSYVCGSCVNMHHLYNIWMWLVVAALYHIAHTCVPGSTTESSFNSGINLSPLLNFDRNELDILLRFVGEPPLPPTSEYTKAFSSATVSTTRPTSNRPIRPQTDHNPVGSIASKVHKVQRPDHSKSGEGRGRSIDAVVDNVLQAYKRVLDKTSRGSLECKSSSTLQLRALSDLWAGIVVDSMSHSLEPPSTRKSFLKRIVKRLLSEELVLENDWFEHLEGVLCNCYNSIVEKVTDATRCNECKIIAGDIVFALFVEDLVTEILCSQHETYVRDAVGRLLELSGISNRKQSVWKDLFDQKQNMATKKKVHIGGKKTSKQGLLSEESLVAAVFSGTVMGGDGKSSLKLSLSDRSSKGNQKRSITSDYEGTDFAPFVDFRLFPRFFDSEETTDEYFDLGNNWKETSLKPVDTPSEGDDGSSNKGSSGDGYRDFLSTEFAHLEKSASPTTYDVTLRSTDHAELTLVGTVIPEDIEGILEGSKY